MEKVSEILQHGLNQVKKGHDRPWTGMCIIVFRMIEKGEITYEQFEQCEKVINTAREQQELGYGAYLMTALRIKHKLQSVDKELEDLWIKWYEDLIAGLQAKGE